MMAKNGSPMCDRCGKFVSWKDIEDGVALFKHWERGFVTLNGPEVADEFDCTCKKCLAKEKE